MTRHSRAHMEPFKTSLLAAKNMGGVAFGGRINGSTLSRA